MTGSNDKTAAELLAELELDPEWRRKRLEREEQEERNRTEFRAKAEPVLADLRAAGLPDEDFGVFMSERAAKVLGAPKIDYKRSVPIFLKWLPIMDDPDVKEVLVMSLATKHARPAAARPLIEEFRKAGNSALGWTIGEALEVVAGNSSAGDLVRLAADPRYGRSRQMIVLALGRMRHPRVVPTLVDLLSDPEMAPSALTALGRLAPIEARSAIEPFAHHSDHWVRRKALTALRRIDKKQKTV